MSNLNRKQSSTLSGGRYKLIFPLHAQRETKPKVSDISHEEVDGLQSPYESFVSKTSSLTQRALLPKITNENVKAQIDLVKQYLQELKIPMTIEGLTSQLLKDNILPYNPYPGYIKRFRRIAQKFYTERLTLKEIRMKLDTPVVTLDRTYLTCVKHDQHTLFGLQHIVSHVHSQTLMSYKSLLTATVTNETASEITGRKITILSSFCGPGIFSNSFYTELLCVDIRVSVLLSASNMKEAAQVFAKVVLEDIKLVLNHNLQHILELEIDVFNQGSWLVRKWSRSVLTSIYLYDDDRRSNVDRVIAEAVENGKTIKLKMMTHNSDRLQGNYIFSTKIYDMLFLKTQENPSRNLQKTSSRSFKVQDNSQLFVSSLPYLALLEGVFLDLSDAHLYISTFEKHYTFPNGKKATKAYPLNPDVLNPVSEIWEYEVASTILEHFAVPTIHYMLLLYLVRNKTTSFSKHTEKDFAIQVARFYNGTSVRLHHALFLIQSLFTLVNSVGESDNATSEILPRIKGLLNDTIQECFCSSSAEKRLLEDLLETTFRSSLAGGNVNISSLRLLSSHFNMAALTANEDVFEHSSAILSFKNQINSFQPKSVPSFIDIPTQSKSQHGVKNNAWVNVDDSKVDMVKSIANSQAPKSVSSTTSFMQYCLDIRMDEVWKEFMELLLLDSDHLPPNPFLHLVTAMRKGNMSVQSLFETDAATIDRVLQRKRIPVQGLSEIINIAGTTAYGYRSSLILCNTLGFRQYSALSTSIFITSPGETTSGYQLQLGPFKATVCSGFVEICPYYGSLTPYLTSVDVDEHFFINGLQSDSATPLSSLAQKLLTSLIELRAQGAVLHQAKFGQVQLDLYTLVNSAARHDISLYFHEEILNLNDIFFRFDSEFTSAVEGNHFVVLSFYFPLTWRYILVKKRVLVYFSQQGGNKMSRMFQHSSYTEKRASTVFLHPNDANYCLRAGRILPHALTNFIKSSWPSRDWSRLIKCMATHAQILISSAGIESRSSLGSDKISNDDLARMLAAFCYRFNNGLPGQLDYLLCMNRTIENLVVHAIAALSESTDLGSVLRLPLVDTMMEEYMIKTREVTSRPSALLPSSFPDFLLTKLKLIAPRNPNSNALHMKYNKTSLEFLQEVDGYLTSIRNSLAEDLLQACPKVSKYVHEQLQHE